MATAFCKSTFVLRFAVVMLGCMLLCGLVWMLLFTQLETPVCYLPGLRLNQQTGSSDRRYQNFVSTVTDFLPEYALFAPDGNVLESNVEGKEAGDSERDFSAGSDDVHVSRRTYADGSTVIIQWYFQVGICKSDPAPICFLLLQYLWLAVLGAGGCSA